MNQCLLLDINKTFPNSQQRAKKKKKNSPRLSHLNSFCIFIFSSTAVFEEPEDPSSRSFFSEIISSISDVKFSHSGRYMMTRDYLSVKVWDLNMENRPVETYQVLPGCCTNSFLGSVTLKVKNLFMAFGFSASH